MAEYIEREAAIDAIMKVYVRTAGYKARERVFEAEEAVRRLPAADVAPVRKGRWLSWEEAFQKTSKRKNNLGVFCDKCHKHNDNRTDYCPNCGAKMDGGIKTDG